VRTSELIGAQWEEFDLDSAVWIIPAARMKMARLGALGEGARVASGRLCG
jgi:integrase